MAASLQDRWLFAHYSPRVPRMWIWVQAAIVVFVIAGMVIAVVKML